MKDSDQHNDDSATPGPNPLKHFVVGAMAMVLLVGLAWLVSGRIVAEKLLTSLTMPVGLIWLALLFVCYFSVVYRARLLSLLGLLSWLLLTFAGNDFVANRLINSLEKDLADARPLAGEPFDVVIVLGGGSSYSISEQPQFGMSGDRIGLAAEMFHAGKAKSFICTGSKIESLSDLESPDEGELTKQLLQRLGVPDTGIETIQGRNTREEIRNLAERLADKSNARVGLLTSAWHMPRALRLAEAAKLQVEPVPADFQSRGIRLTVLSVVPSAAALRTTTAALKEYLARLAGQ